MSGKYNNGVPSESRLAQPGYAWLREAVLENDGSRLEKVRRLAPIAAELDVSMAQLAIAWCLANPHVSTVMLGASKLEQLEQNLGALALLTRLDADVLKHIAQAVA